MMRYSNNSNPQDEELEKAYKTTASKARKAVLVPIIAIVLAEFISVLLKAKGRNITSDASNNPMLKYAIAVAGNQLYTLFAIILISAFIFWFAYKARNSLYIGGKFKFNVSRSFLKHTMEYSEPLWKLTVVYQGIIVIGALITLFGFVFLVFGGRIQDLFICAAINLVYLWTFYPRYDEWESFYKRESALAQPPAPGAASVASVPADGIIRVDKEFRKKFLLLLILFTAFGASLLYGAQVYSDYLNILYKSDPHTAVVRMIFLFEATFVAISFFLISVGAYCIYLSARIFKSGQYPPPGMKLLRDTRISSGLAAARKAVALVMFSVFFFFIGSFLLYKLPPEVNKIFSKPAYSRYR